MAEYKLSYTGAQIDAKLRQIDSKANASDIPTKVSELENDSGYLTTKPAYTASEVGADASGTANSVVSSHNTNSSAHADIREEIKQLSSEIEDISTFVTPQMYGAIGDGVADDTQAINDALASGNKVFFPVGTYKVTSSLILPYGICISGVSGLSVIKTYITNGYVLTGEGGSTTLASANIEGLTFENNNAQNSTTKLICGNFVYKTTALYMRNCRVKKYYNVFNSIENDSFILHCRFTAIYNQFLYYATDSVVDGCYINASRYGFPYKSKCIANSFNSTVFTNNLVDYFYSVFATSSCASGSVVRNTFNRCVNVFHDNLQHITISNNIFTGIERDAVDLSVLTSEQIASLEAEKWCVIKFDNTAVSASNHVMSLVIFTNNVGYNCQYYFYVADDVSVIPADCEFRGNQISTGSYNQLSSVDVGFRNTIATEENYSSMKNCFFDFWDMKEYDILPSATFYGDGAKMVKTFPYMRAVYNGDIYTNIDGTWVKCSGATEVDLTEYVKTEELDRYVTDAEMSKEVASLKAQVVQQVPLFVSDIDECSDNSKVYVLPDGYIYGYMTKQEEIVSPGVTTPSKAAIVVGQRYSHSEGIFKAASGVASLIIPVDVIKNYEYGDEVPFTLNGMVMNKTYQNVYYGETNTSFPKTGNKTTTDRINMTLYNLAKGKWFICIFVDSTGASDEFNGVSVTFNDTTIACEVCADSTYATHGSITAGSTEIIETAGFMNTGHAFVPADYESRILALEAKITELELRLT